jgi:hypothetical protein
MSRTDQYRLNSADCLSLASKADESYQVSHFIDMALYWFNMAEKVETNARIMLRGNGPDLSGQKQRTTN